MALWQRNSSMQKYRGMEDIKAGRVYTAGVKKNLWGRVLRKGESQRRSDGRYCTYRRMWYYRSEFCLI